MGKVCVSPAEVKTDNDCMSQDCYAGIIKLLSKLADIWCDVCEAKVSRTYLM